MADWVTELLHSFRQFFTSIWILSGIANCRVDNLQHVAGDIFGTPFLARNMQVQFNGTVLTVLQAGAVLEEIAVSGYR